MVQEEWILYCLSGEFPVNCRYEQNYRCPPIHTILLSSALAGSTLYAAGDLGYKDTPMLPGGKWHVHDPDRPMAPVVKPAATFSQGAPAPADAVVLFDGKDLSRSRAQPVERKEPAMKGRLFLRNRHRHVVHGFVPRARGQNQHSQQHDTAERCAHSRLGCFR